MNQLMETLLTLLDSPQSEPKVQTRAATREAIRIAEERLTADEFENLWSEVIDVFHNDGLNSFTLGFRLGVQLTLEGLRPVCPDQPA